MSIELTTANTRTLSGIRQALHVPDNEVGIFTSSIVSPLYYGVNDGGTLNMSGSGDYMGGSINTSASSYYDGGSINTFSADYMGGSIDTSNGGGDINTSGSGSYMGGSINTSSTASSYYDGGSINTISGYYMGGSICMSGDDGYYAGNIDTRLGVGNIFIDSCIVAARGGTDDMGPNTGAVAGYINISGGFQGMDASCSAGTGGSLIMMGGDAGDNSHRGGNAGSINTSGSDADSHAHGQAGGSINTSNGGGSINTTGSGYIQFGYDTFRTTLSGTATQNRTVLLPDASGTLVISTSSTTFTNPVTANGEFLILNINGTNKAIQLWEFTS